jgi:5'-methylthioadenosine phosphorylase
MLGIIAGSAFLQGGAVPHTEVRRVATPRGPVMLHVGDGFAFLRRHGEDGYRPPHRLPHHAHVLAFEAVGVRQVAALASTGSLKAALLPGAVLVPDDYLSLHPPPTFAGDEYLHIVPALDATLRTLLLSAAAAAGADDLHDGGVYVQTHGPRFETAAEVRMIAAHGDVVGMTAASEATLFQERDVAYAVLCLVDNQANGVGAVPLTLEAYRQQLAANGALARRIVDELIAARTGPAVPGSARGGAP